MKEYIDVLKKWKDFDGRARRREYWMFVLFMAIFAIVASIIDAILGTICVFVGIYYLAMLLPMIAVSIRRMHDIGKRRMVVVYHFRTGDRQPLVSLPDYSGRTAG